MVVEVPYEGDPGCWWHGPEPIPPGAFRVCGECWHCFVTEADLRAADEELRRQIGLQPTDPDAPIWVCPLCTHDF